MQRLLLYARPTWMLWSGLLLMLIIAVGAAWSSLDEQHRELKIEHLRDYRTAVNLVQVAMLDMETGQRGYLITGNEAYLEPYEEGRRLIVVALGDLARFNIGKMGLPAPKLPIAALVAEKTEELDQTVWLRRDFGAEAATQVLATDFGRKVMTALREELELSRTQAGVIAFQQQRRNASLAYVTVGLIAAGLLLSGGLSATSVILLRREIAVRISVETAMRQRETELARSNDELEQFAHIASHDLQEPLRMISGYTQLLGRRYVGKLDADADEFIGYAVDGTKRMQVLINDLLNFSRVTVGAKPLEPVDLEEALIDTLKDLEVRIEERGAAVTHDKLPTVRADPVQMRQLLLNLIGNGMKFQNGERKPTVAISAARQGREWRFGVRDNGIGIEAQYFKNLFQIFKRLHSREEYPGTGIGLAVCKKIVERHGGRIWVESVLGQGSTFLFTLPAMETRS